MAGYTGFVDNTTGLLIAHENFIDLLEAKALLNGWTTLRKGNIVGGTGNARRYELIMQSAGLSGTEQIFIGVQAYQDSTNDYYNITFAVFTGYVAANTFLTQPGYCGNSACAHNQRIDYFININAQRWTGVLKVGNPVYEHFYIGKFFPFCTPAQYPYPVVCSATLNGQAATRYSVVDGNNHRMSYPGNFADPSQRQFQFRDNTGNWQYLSRQLPWASTTFNGSGVRDNNGQYHLDPVQICYPYTDGPSTVADNTWGQLDGIFFCSGFNLTVESTTTISGKTYALLQDINRNTVGSYIALDITP